MSTTDADGTRGLWASRLRGEIAGRGRVCIELGGILTVCADAAPDDRDHHDYYEGRDAGAGGGKD